MICIEFKDAMIYVQYYMLHMSIVLSKYNLILIKVVIIIISVILTILTFNKSLHNLILSLFPCLI